MIQMTKRWEWVVSNFSVLLTELLMNKSTNNVFFELVMLC